MSYKTFTLNVDDIMAYVKFQANPLSFDTPLSGWNYHVLMIFDTEKRDFLHVCLGGKGLNCNICKYHKMTLYKPYHPHRSP